METNYKGKTKRTNQKNKPKEQTKRTNQKNKQKEQTKRTNQKNKPKEQTKRTNQKNKPKEQTKRTFPQTQKCRAHTNYITIKHADIDLGPSQYQARTDITHVVCGNMSCHE
jgi:outer membrane biosynthesis protein TonB